MAMATLMLFFYKGIQAWAQNTLKAGKKKKKKGLKIIHIIPVFVFRFLKTTDKGEFIKSASV